EQLSITVDLERPRAFEGERNIGRGGGKTIGDGGYDFVDAHALRANLQRPREVEQRVDGARELLRFLFRAADLRRGLFGSRALREPQVAEDREKGVAELVRDTRRHLSESDEVFQIAQPPFHRAEGGEIGEE